MRPPDEYFSELVRVSDRCLVFGGNFFADILPEGKHWVVWDKLNTMPSFGDCELIWTNIPRKSVKKFTFEWNGLLGKEKQPRIHPTQKPVALYKWLLKNYAKPGDKILDTHLGSGSSAIAAYEMKQMEREIKELKRANEILRKAAAFFAQAELDRPHK